MQALRENSHRPVFSNRRSLHLPSVVEGLVFIAIGIAIASVFAMHGVFDVNHRPMENTLKGLGYLAACGFGPIALGLVVAQNG